jgi:hypothetical protein
MPNSKLIPPNNTGKKYASRKTLLKLIQGKSLSTKRYIYEHLKNEVDKNSITKKLQAAARKLGVRIKSVQLV